MEMIGAVLQSMQAAPSWHKSLFPLPAALDVCNQ